MTRCLIFCNFAAWCLAGCCCAPPQAQRFVPASSVVQIEPLPTTHRGFQDAEQQGCLVVATGRGAAFDALDQPTQMYEGQAVHVLHVDAESGEVLACRQDDHKLVRLSPDALELETTTYGR